MKLCKDCKHFNDVGYLCVRGERQVGVNPVNGNPEHRYKVLDYAWNQRESILPWKCGKKGRHFVARGAK